MASHSSRDRTKRSRTGSVSASTNFNCRLRTASPIISRLRCSSRLCCSMINGRSLGRDERRRGGKPAETPFPAAEIGDCCAQVFGAKIGPQRFDEVELRVGRFPQQEVGEALFAAGADEQVDIAARLALRRREEMAER